ncbi:hypothetical protein STEG23_023359, partial [Scotinomys teguina]
MCGIKPDFSKVESILAFEKSTVDWMQGLVNAIQVCYLRTVSSFTSLLFKWAISWIVDRPSDTTSLKKASFTFPNSHQLSIVPLLG